MSSETTAPTRLYLPFPPSSELCGRNCECWTKFGNDPWRKIDELTCHLAYKRGLFEGESMMFVERPLAQYG